MAGNQNPAKQTKDIPRGANMAGWVKLHRKLIENPIIAKPELLQLFIYCLLKANHEPKRLIFNGKSELIERGQFITGRKVLENDLCQNGRSTYDRLKILENLKILSCKSNNKFTLVTIDNYGLYQSVDEQSTSKTNNQLTTSQQPANTNKKLKNYKNDKNKDISKKSNLSFIGGEWVDINKLLSGNGEK